MSIKPSDPGDFLGLRDSKTEHFSWAFEDKCFQKHQSQRCHNTAKWCRWALCVWEGDLMSEFNWILNGQLQGRTGFSFSGCSCVWRWRVTATGQGECTWIMALVALIAIRQWSYQTSFCPYYQGGPEHAHLKSYCSHWRYDTAGAELSAGISVFFLVLRIAVPLASPSLTFHLLFLCVMTPPCSNSWFVPPMTGWLSSLINEVTHICTPKCFLLGGDSSHYHK